MERRSNSIADQIFEILERDILSEKFPRGEVLTENRLSELLEVSRTPVREQARAGASYRDDHQRSACYRHIKGGYRHYL